MRLSQHRLRTSERCSSRKKSYADPEQEVEPCSRSVFAELIEAAAHIEKEMELQRQLIQDLGHKQSADILFDALYQLHPHNTRRCAGIQIYEFQSFLESYSIPIDRGLLRAWYFRLLSSWEGKGEVNLMILRSYLQPREQYFLGRDQSLKSSKCNANEIQSAFYRLLTLDINTGPKLERLKLLMSKYSPTLMFEEIVGSSSITITPERLRGFLECENQKLSQKTAIRALIRICGNTRADRSYGSESDGVNLEEWRSFFAPRPHLQPSISHKTLELQHEQSTQDNIETLEFLLQYITTLQKIEDARCHLINREEPNSSYQSTHSQNLLLRVKCLEDFVPMALFKLADRNRLFFLTHDDLKAFLERLGLHEHITLSHGQMRFLLSAYDSDRDGVLSFEEFQDIFLPLDKVAKAQLLKRQPFSDLHSPARYSRETRGALMNVLKNVVLQEHTLEHLRMQCDKTKLKELFRFIDVENRGKSGMQIIQEYFLKSGVEISYPQLRLLLARLDSDFDGCLNLDEILREMKPHAPAYYRVNNH